MSETASLGTASICFYVLFFDRISSTVHYKQMIPLISSSIPTKGC
ncbi:hypothetical protein SynBIOSE41_00906 [Synechococcus sp. BIOS-E4-1]|nr:hypothetical protein SynBIOSE41_00906 [Synechococcus sp. BIOS-E4-1]